MVDTGSDGLRAKLKLLSKREMQVLDLRCQGMKYVDVGKALNIAVPTVKTDMGRVYMKLGLDVIEPSQRLKVLYETVGPLLRSIKSDRGKAETGSVEQAASPAVVDGEVVPEQEEPIPPKVKDMVEEDDKAIVPVSPSPLAPPLPERRRRWTVALVLGVVLGICLGGGAVYLLLRSSGGPLGAVPEPTSTEALPAAPPAETAFSSPTGVILTQTERVVVVTATSAPATELPSLTPLPQAQVLFADNFDQGLSGSWSVVSGNPVVVNGQLTSDQNTWLRIGDNTWTDFSVQFTVQTADCWFYDRWNAVGVRVQDPDNMIAFQWASCENQWDIVRNGNWSTVPNSHVSNGDYGSGPITVSVMVQGGQFSVDINGSRVSSFFNSDYAQGGVALRVGAKTQIDDFKVTTIQK